MKRSEYEKNARYIHKAKDGFYFYDETWSNTIGPYKTIKETLRALKRYVACLNKTGVIINKSQKVERAQALRRFTDATKRLSRKGEFTENHEMTTAIIEDYKESRKEIERLLFIR